jgi:hypothetical protein
MINAVFAEFMNASLKEKSRSQWDNVARAVVSACGTTRRERSCGFDQVQVLINVWLKNDQAAASHAVLGAAGAMNGLSTGCSTVIVRKPETRA